MSVDVEFIISPDVIEEAVHPPLPPLPIVSFDEIERDEMYTGGGGSGIIKDSEECAYIVLEIRGIKKHICPHDTSEPLKAESEYFVSMFAIVAVPKEGLVMTPDISGHTNATEGKIVAFLKAKYSRSKMCWCANEGLLGEPLDAMLPLK